MPILLYSRAWQYWHSKMSMKTPADVGAALRARRERLGLSQQEFASKIGTTQGRISRFERGDGATNLRTFLQLLAALNLELALGTEPKRDDADKDEDEIDLGAIANTGLKPPRRAAKRQTRGSDRKN